MSLELVESLFNQNISVNCGESGYATKNNLLHYIASRPFNQNDFYVFHDYLSKYSQKVDEKNSLGYTPLMVCIVNKDPSVIYFIDLLNNGADPNIQINVYSHQYFVSTILTLAIISNCSLNILKYLVVYGTSNIDDQKHPLLCACKYSDLIVIKYIHSKFGGINTCDESGATPLHYVCYYRTDDNPDIIRFLLDSGADINKKDSYFNTPFSMAVKSNKLRVIKELSIFIFEKYKDEEDFIKKKIINDFFEF